MSSFYCDGRERFKIEEFQKCPHYRGVGHRSACPNFVLKKERSSKNVNLFPLSRCLNH